MTALRAAAALPRPRTLWGQVAALLVAGLVLAYAVSLWAAARQREHMLDAMMLPHVSRDVASALDLLDRLPAAERAAWLTRLSRPNYRFVLEAAQPAAAPAGTFAQRLAGAIGSAGGPQRVLGPGTLAGGTPALRLRLGDGSPAALVLRLPGPQGPWLSAAALLAQIAVIALCIAAAARLVTRPMQRLATAAHRLGDDPQAPPLPEEGPLEVRQAAAAFNAMQRRIARHMDERLEILAAIAHDLQTPLTRLRMRCELLGPHPERPRLLADLSEMQHLVEEGLAYARSAHAASEPDELVDLHALLDTLVCDRTDAGQTVTPDLPPGLTVRTRPQALRRIVGNLLDNALKFAGAAELRVDDGPAGELHIAVLDRGPGIPAEDLPRMLQPFERLESSRSRETGGSGLGLAIAMRLSQAIGAQLQLAPRPGGGLRAAVVLPAAARPAPAVTQVKLGGAAQP